MHSGFTIARHLHLDSTLVFKIQTWPLIKGIQHGISYLRYMIQGMNENKTKFLPCSLITTCFFHVGGFLGIFELMTSR